MSVTPGSTRDLPPDLLQRPAEESVRRIALAQLEEWIETARRLSDPADAEALHDTRVALRRLRSTLSTWKVWLRGSARKKEREALRALQQATGAGRDAEVGAAWLAERRLTAPAGAHRGQRWLADRLRKLSVQARGQAAKTLHQAFGSLGKRLRRRLSTYRVRVEGPRELEVARMADAFARVLRERADRLRDALALLTSPDQAAEAHAARIAGKRLRYLLEPFRGVLPGAEDVLGRLRELQQRLGALQDLLALGQSVEGAAEESALAHARRLHKAARKGGTPASGGRDPRRAGLLQLTREVEHARVAGFSELLTILREGSLLSALNEGVTRLLDAARAEARHGREIERKYLLSELPPQRPPGAVIEVEQGWLPGHRLVERLRRAREGERVELVRAVKVGRGLVRVELEEACPAALFDALWPFTSGCRVLKRRHRIVEGPHVWELDVFLDRDLVLAEVELASPEELVTLPPWLEPFVLREVTEEEAFVNRNLAR